MEAAFGILNFIYARISDDNQRIWFNQLLQISTKELGSKLIKEIPKSDKTATLEILSEIFREVIPMKFIPSLKLMLSAKPASYENILAYVLFSYYLFVKMAEIDIKLTAWNNKLEDILNLSKSLAITPNHLGERANWILNFNRLNELYQQKWYQIQKEIKFKTMEIFENKWKTLIARKNRQISTLNVLLDNYKDMKPIVINFNKFKKEIFAVKNWIKYNKYVYNNKFNNNSANNSCFDPKILYIGSRLINKLSKMIKYVNYIQGNVRNVLEKLQNEENDVQLGKLQQTIEKLQRDERNLIDKLTNNTSYQMQLENYEKVWKQMDLSRIEKLGLTLNLQYNYIINKLENYGGSGQLSKILDDVDESADESTEFSVASNSNFRRKLSNT